MIETGTVKRDKARTKSGSSGLDDWAWEAWVGARRAEHVFPSSSERRCARASLPQNTPHSLYVYTYLLDELSHRTLTMPPCKHSSYEDSRFYSFVRPPRQRWRAKNERGSAARAATPSVDTAPTRPASWPRLFVYTLSTRFSFITHFPLSLSLVCFFGRVCVYRMVACFPVIFSMHFVYVPFPLARQSHASRYGISKRSSLSISPWWASPGSQRGDPERRPRQKTRHEHRRRHSEKE